MLTKKKAPSTFSASFHPVKKKDVSDLVKEQFKEQFVVDR